MPMTDPPHPGLSVRYDCLEPLGLTVTEAAKGLGVSPQTVVGHRQWPVRDLPGHGDPSG